MIFSIQPKLKRFGHRKSADSFSFTKAIIGSPIANARVLLRRQSKPPKHFTLAKAPHPRPAAPPGSARTAPTGVALVD
jgi:hypothetical protein